MLIRFEASNYRSIDGPAALSMVAIDRERPEARQQPRLGESLLPVAAIYGPNASGKSNIVSAFVWVRDAVRISLRAWDDQIPTDPFAFGDGKERPSKFIIELTIEGIRFEYVLEIDNERVLYEALFHYPEQRQRRIFERDSGELKLQRGLGNLSGTRKLLTERTLALSIARRFDEPLVTRFTNELMRTHALGLPARRGRALTGSYVSGQQAISQSTLRWFEERDPTLPFEESQLAGPYESDRDRALALLRLADLGIDDVLVDTEQITFTDSAETTSRRRVRLVHRTKEERAPFDFNSESEGTRTWFRLIGPILSALENGSLLLFDELDASLHPTLSAQLIGLFHSPITNPRGAQLIFTSHDTSLLNHLNRDEVWLTEKDANGSTYLGALADFAGERVRKSQNLENAYLHGRFGALPQVDQAEFLRALGLIG